MHNLIYAENHDFSLFRQYEKRFERNHTFFLPRKKDAKPHRVLRQKEALHPAKGGSKQDGGVLLQELFLKGLFSGHRRFDVPPLPMARFKRRTFGQEHRAILVHKASMAMKRSHNIL